MLPGEKKK